MRLARAVNALSGSLKKRKGLLVSGQKDEAGVMRYRIGEGVQ